MKKSPQATLNVKKREKCPGPTSAGGIHYLPRKVVTSTITGVLDRILFLNTDNLHLCLYISLVTPLLNTVSGTPFTSPCTGAHKREGPSRSSYHHLLPLGHLDSVPQTYQNLGSPEAVGYIHAFVLCCMLLSAEKTMIILPGYCNL